MWCVLFNQKINCCNLNVCILPILPKFDLVFVKNLREHSSLKVCIHK